MATSTPVAFVQGLKKRLTSAVTANNAQVSAASTLSIETLRMVQAHLRTAERTVLSDYWRSMVHRNYFGTEPQPFKLPNRRCQPTHQSRVHAPWPHLQFRAHGHTSLLA